ncbi:hypothetical protein [Cryobacterium sp. Y11]|uniref:hypothetical protein n=1 Tax=Cryobacterium sp. Y11 TaxID=2045016 RepID=UPI00130480EF|nr:hypothetical protein [Cryobacterium sp. Y11]
MSVRRSPALVVATNLRYAGHTLNDIADRFGITLDDLNLSVTLRGGASVPPPWG